MRFLLLLLILTITSRAAEDPLIKGPGIRLSLLSEVAAIQPGKPFTVGIQLLHQPGFHSYWKHPGLVGVPTSVSWTLPPGFHASQIRWPYPERTTMAEYPCHGYQRDTILLVTISPPLSISAPPVTLSADLTWLACAKGCFPGQKTHQLILPIASEDIPSAHVQALLAAKKEIPQLPHGLPLKATRDPDQKTVTLTLPQTYPAGTDLYFFSNDGQIPASTTQESLQTDGKTHLTLPLSDFFKGQAKTLRGVLKISDDYYQISVPYRLK